MHSIYPKVTYNPGEKKTLKDRSGDGIDVVEVDGINIPTVWSERGMLPDPRISIPKIKDLDVRKDDVFICAYPKAGTHWVWEIVSMLKSGKSDFQMKSKTTASLDFQSIENLDSLPSPRVFNTHMLFRNMPKGIVENRGKVIFVQRNPKDVAVSFLYHIRNLPYSYNPEWSNFFHKFISDDMLFAPFVKYTNDWESNLSKIPQQNLLLLYYEDIKQKPEFEITKIAKFIGVDWNNKDFMEEIANKTNFKTMKPSKTRLTGDEHIDEQRRIYQRLYRKGEIGDWKNYFTVAQNEEFDKYMKETMKNSSFVYTYM